ncbi:hypothetical protein C4M98_01275, partial [Mycoplasmopsis pullorum]
MTRQKRIYLFKSSILSILILLLLLFLFLYQKNQPLNFFQKYNIYTTSYNYFYWIHSFLIVTLVFVYINRLLILYKFWSKQNNQNFFKRLILLIPFLDLFLLRQNFELINSKQDTSDTKKGYESWVAISFAFGVIFAIF